ALCQMPVPDFADILTKFNNLPDKPAFLGLKISGDEPVIFALKEALKPGAGQPVKDLFKRILAEDNDKARKLLALANVDSAKVTELVSVLNGETALLQKLFDLDHQNCNNASSMKALSEIAYALKNNIDVVNAFKALRDENARCFAKKADLDKAIVLKA